MLVSRLLMVGVVSCSYYGRDFVVCIRLLVL